MRFWRGLGNDDIDDPDYLDSEFVFYDENAELVKVKVRDAYDTVMLGYTHEWVENIWLNLSLSSLSNGVVATISEGATVCRLGEAIMDICSLLVSRNLSSANSGKETIVLDGIEGVLRSPALFSVYINLPGAHVHTLPNCTEYVGRFSAMAQSLVVTIVPNTHPPLHPVSIAAVWIEYELLPADLKRSREAASKTLGVF